MVGTMELARKTTGEILAIGDKSAAHVGGLGKMMLIRANGGGDGLVSMGCEELTNTWQLPHARRSGPFQNPRAGWREVAARDEEFPERERKRSHGQEEEKRKASVTPPGSASSTG